MPEDTPEQPEAVFTLEPVVGLSGNVDFAALHAALPKGKTEPSEEKLADALEAGKIDPPILLEGETAADIIVTDAAVYTLLDKGRGHFGIMLGDIEVESVRGAEAANARLVEINAAPATTETEE